MSRNRHRAVASFSIGPGYPPVVMGRCYCRTRAGLQRFIDEHEAAGHTVKVWELLPLREVDEHVSQGDPGVRSGA